MPRERAKIEELRSSGVIEPRDAIAMVVAHIVLTTVRHPIQDDFANLGPADARHLRQHGQSIDAIVIDVLRAKLVEPET